MNRVMRVWGCVSLALTILAVQLMPARADDSIAAWGRNDAGQCSVPSPSTGFTAVAAGGGHSLGLKANGTIVAWGQNTSGQCNVPSPNTGFTAVAAGYDHSLGLKADGTIVAWGQNVYGECSVPLPNENFRAVAAGFGYSLGLKADGTIVAWGQNVSGECNVPSPNEGFRAVATGRGHSLGLKANGSIVAWGENNRGQCDIPEPNTGFTAIAAGHGHSLGLKADGSIAAWGWNIYGQCNVPAENQGFVAVAAGSYHSLGLKVDGSIAAWGQSTYAQCEVPLPNADFTGIAGGTWHSLALQRCNLPADFENSMQQDCLVDGLVLPYIYVDANGHRSEYHLYDMEDSAIWTGVYLAAESYRYAVTGDPEARARITEVLAALKKLRTVCEGVPGALPGLVSRGYMSVEIPDTPVSEEHLSADGQYRWKGDVSSDQIDGMIYGYSVCYDLAATSEERASIANEVSMIVTHLLDHDLRMIDVDGEETTWARYYPSFVIPRGEFLNAMLLLSHLRVAIHMNPGNSRFREQYEYIASYEGMGYAHITAFSTIRFLRTWELNHSDNNLIAIGFQPLLRLSDEPEFRPSYEAGFDYFWDLVKGYGQSLFNLIRYEFHPQDARIGDALAVLRRFPANKVRYEVLNSENPAFAHMKPFIGTYPNLYLNDRLWPPVPIELRPVAEYEWTQNPYRLNGWIGETGAKAASPVDFLAAYWYSRYLGLPAHGDVDEDGDVDGFDFLTFSNCYNGSNRPLLAACANTAADLEGDGDVDGFDFLTFTNCYNGSNNPPRCP